ncbi:LysR family transcriptional regulator [Thiosulfativibrio zosterae]|uniref:LysR family transcriptional regulator n=1 Tax=Thiosulfativibrio zosterae TaxID=2675053 RepID=A0A6F8PMN3_9GAMM|nr:LysR family transcriptional regulator [Thiosulfativibrio zosterae]BBP43260.1 LysR family transcriptional regulator [Thiosulfativibrio zosterae]
MGQLEEIEIFIRVVEAGGVGKAAEQLNMAKSAVSRRLADLEARLGIKLISRTTRTSNLTEAGRLYYEKSLRWLEALEEMNHEVSNQNAYLMGSLRMSVPLSFGLLHLKPAIEAFAKQHPQLHLEIDFTDRKVNLIEEGLDLALRIGRLQDSSIQARKLFRAQLGLYASPDYLAEKGEPKTFEDLEHHAILRYSNDPNPKLEMTDANGQLYEMPIKGNMSANNGEFLRDMAAAGQGLVVLPSFIAWQAEQQGALKRILPDFGIADVAGYLVYPQNRYLPQKSRLFIDYLAAYFAKNRIWEL